MSDARPQVTDWATDFDHTRPEYAQNAPEVWEELRATCPVAHTDRFGGAWLPVNHDVLEVVARLDAQEGQVQPAAGQRAGEVGGVVADDRDLDVREFVPQHPHCRRQPIHLVPGLEADGEGFPSRLRSPAGGFARGFDMHQRQAGVVEKG